MDLPQLFLLVISMEHYLKVIDTACVLLDLYDLSLESLLGTSAVSSMLNFRYSFANTAADCLSSIVALGTGGRSGMCTQFSLGIGTLSFMLEIGVHLPRWKYID